MSSKNICFKDSNKPAHWVVNLKLRSLDIDELFKRTPNFDEKETSVTGKKEEDKNTSKNDIDDADTNAEDNEKNYKDE